MTVTEINNWLRHSLGYWMKRVSDMYEALLDSAVLDRPLPLRDLQFEALVVLSRSVCEDQSSLARALGIDTSSITAILDQLERMKLGRRRRRSDRRRYSFELSKDAPSVIAAEWRVRKLAQDRVFSTLSAADGKWLLEQLDWIARHSDAQAPEWVRLTDGQPAGNTEYSLDDLYGSLAFLIRRCGQIGRALALEVVAPLDLTEGQAMILYVTCLQPEVDLSYLVRIFHTERPTISKILKTLEARSWIEREVDPADKRRTRIMATPAGREMMNSIKYIWDHGEDRLNACLPRHDLRSVIDLLESMVASPRALPE